MDTNLAVVAPTNPDAPLFTPAPTINYRKQKGNLFDVGADVNINPANNQQSLPGTLAVAASTGPGVLATGFEAGLVLDGVTLVLGNIILIKDQAAPAENGVYVVTAGAPTRATGWTNGVGLQAFQQTVKAVGGTVNKGKFFVQTNNILSPFIVVGTTPLLFKEDRTQMTHQKAILAATAVALTRQNVRPLTSSPFLREFGGVITYDNNTLEQFYSKYPVQAATTAALAANTYNNGAGTLTATGNGAIAPVDGYQPVVGDRLLVQNEVAPAHNGIYLVTAVGDASNPYVLTRVLDASEGSTGADADTQVRFGMCVFVLGGTANGKNTFFQATANPITLGTTSLVFKNLTTVMTVNLSNQPVDGNKNIDSQVYAQA